jgi:hypothetical protein
MRSRRVGQAALGALVVALVAGCAGIPTSGPVHQAGQLNGVGDEPFTRIVAAGPAEGADPDAILTGFLAASASFDDDHAVARQFLTANASRTWSPTERVVVYQPVTGPPGPFSGGKDAFHFSAPQVGMLTAQGAYTGSPGGTVVTADFTLTKVDGQWRIDKLPPGLLLTTNDLTRAYQSYDIYFPNAARDVLVPDEVLLPRGPGVSTSLVRAVLQGPTPWLSKAVRTAVPTGTHLVVDSVPVSDGVAQVDLTGPAASISRSEAQAMSAQIVWTLRQLGGVTGVRITVDGVPLRVPGVGDLQGIGEWQSYDPDGGMADAKGYAVSDKGRAVVVSDQAQGSLLPVRGPLGDGSITSALVVPSYDGTTLAALDPDRRRLIVAGMTSGAKADVVLTGTRLTAPSWDRQGDLFVVNTAGPTANAWMVPAGTTQPRRVTIDASGLPHGSTITTLRVSRDGTRVALVVSSKGIGQAYLGLLHRSGDGVALSGFRTMTTGNDATGGSGSVVDVAWATADRLLLLTRSGPDRAAISQAGLVDLNGTDVLGYGTLPDGVMAAVAAAPGHFILSSDTAGSVWRYNNGIGSWRRLGNGVLPAYPG